MSLILLRIFSRRACPECIEGSKGRFFVLVLNSFQYQDKEVRNRYGGGDFKILRAYSVTFTNDRRESARHKSLSNIFYFQNAVEPEAALLLS